jgi:hypothetical protein
MIECKFGEAHDAAQAYLFLMQEGFGTGQTVVVDGGTVLVWGRSEKNGGLSSAVFDAMLGIKGP